MTTTQFTYKLSGFDRTAFNPRALRHAADLITARESASRPQARVRMARGCRAVEIQVDEEEASQVYPGEQDPCRRVARRVLQDLMLVAGVTFDATPTEELMKRETGRDDPFSSALLGGLTASPTREPRAKEGPKMRQSMSQLRFIARATLASAALLTLFGCSALQERQAHQQLVARMTEACNSGDAQACSVVLADQDAEAARRAMVGAALLNWSAQEQQTQAIRAGNTAAMMGGYYGPRY